MSKYWIIFSRVFWMSVMQAMMYKQDFILASVTSLVYFLTQLFLILMFFEAGNIDKVAGYSMYDIYFIFVLVQFVIGFVFVFVHTSARYTIDQIHNGGLDVFLMKPADSRFLISLQSFRASHAYMIFMFVFIALPLVLMKVDYGFVFWDFVIIGYLLLISFVVYAVMYWMAALIHLIVPRLWGPWMFLGNIGDIIKYPKGVYPGLMGRLLTYVVPVFLVVNPIYKVIDGSFAFIDFVEISLLAVVFVLLYLLMWEIGLRRYNSAN